MKNSEELSPERIAVQKQAQDLHEINLRQGRYSVSAFVTVKWTTEPETGLRWPRRLRRTWHERTESRQVFSLTPPDNNVVMIDDGQLALRKDQTKNYILFDFNAASADDFQIIREAVRRRREQA
jgi:hypothetical protein